MISQYRMFNQGLRLVIVFVVIVISQSLSAIASQTNNNQSTNEIIESIIQNRTLLILPFNGTTFPEFNNSNKSLDVYIKYDLRKIDNIKSLSSIFNVKTDIFKDSIPENDNLKHASSLIIPIVIHYPKEAMNAKKISELYELEERQVIALNNITAEEEIEKPIILPLLDRSRKISIIYPQLEKKDDVKKNTIVENVKDDEVSQEINAITDPEDQFIASINPFVKVKEGNKPLYVYPLPVKSPDQLSQDIGKVNVEEETAKPVSQVKEVVNNNVKEYIWPLKGRITYVNSNNTVRKEILIKPSNNSSKQVKAIYDGQIIYKGNDHPKYKNMIIISHPNNYLSIYGNLEKVTLVKGAKIKKGDEVGVIGNGKDLYFGIRHNKVAVEPKEILPKI